MRIEVDKERCVGAGMCALTAPDVFTQDDDGFSEVLPGRDTAAAEQPLVKEAVRACPVSAVELVTGD
ncbi:ferredoxin [Streptomyces sp. SID8379]|uniref:ferredoxin n=1 Tax=unclassified Streptomyces TaxID=2593676 RepID=UPI00039D6D86|nr:ferredoxin [Streptomyces sp. HmicA12]MYW70027.1 ferredoxin [Streptomyces sp. SID8379]